MIETPLNLWYKLPTLLFTTTSFTVYWVEFSLDILNSTSLATKKYVFNRPSYKLGCYFIPLEVFYFYGFYSLAATYISFAFTLYYTIHSYYRFVQFEHCQSTFSTNHSSTLQPNDWTWKSSSFYLMLSLLFTTSSTKSELFKS